MNKKTQKKYVALLTLLAMVVCTMFCTNTVKADTNLPWDESEVAKTSTCVINGVERTLTLLKEGDSYIQIGNSEPILISFNMPEVGFDQYGSVWGVYYLDTAICWWNYDLSPDDMTLHNINRPTAENPNAYVNDVESLIFDENDQFVVGYKTFSGQTYSILTLDEMKSYFPNTSTPTPTPTPSNIPNPTPTVPETTPNVPTPPAPTVSPVATPPTTSTPAVTPKTTVTPKVSVKKKAGYNCLSLGSKITSKYKLTKGKLTWKGSSKSKKYS